MGNIYIIKFGKGPALVMPIIVVSRCTQSGGPAQRSLYVDYRVFNSLLLPVVTFIQKHKISPF